MAVITWDNTGDRLFETGLDRGVLYLPNGDGIPWNGLISVSETQEEEASEPYHLDGVMYFQDQTISDFGATIQAFTYPDELLEFEGTAELDAGVFANDQAVQRFSMAYRTLVGNDIEGTDYGYKLHVVYNLTAVPSNKVYATLTNTPSPTLFSWNIVSVPETVPGFRPTAHLIIDSRYANPYFLEALEDKLYGNEGKDAKLPSLEDFTSYAVDWKLIEIIDHGDGTWTAEGPADLIKMLDATTFQITGVNATYLDANTYTISTTT